MTVFERTFLSYEKLLWKISKLWKNLFVEKLSKCFRELFAKTFTSFRLEFRQPSWLVVQIKLVCLSGHRI